MPHFPEVIGLLRVRSHCLFTWRERGSRRVIEITDAHCEACIEEVRSRGYDVRRTEPPSADGRKPEPTEE